jgi:hypothetical protein
MEGLYIVLSKPNEDNIDQHYYDQWSIWSRMESYGRAVRATYEEGGKGTTITNGNRGGDYGTGVHKSTPACEYNIPCSRRSSACERQDNGATEIGDGVIKRQSLVGSAP